VGDDAASAGSGGAAHAAAAARGVQRMIAEDRDCLEILTQLASLRSAAYSASVALTKHYAVQCVRGAEQQASPDSAVRDLVEVLLRTPH
jgi:DNA-binding FrmR family transcriptional regulator